MELTPELSHEVASKERLRRMQTVLDKFYTEKSSLNDINQLTDLLDTQIKMEDYMIRFREADHAKVKIYWPIIVPAIISLIACIVSILVTCTKLNPHNH